MNALFSLKEKVALITGGSGDIGKAIARAYAEAGARLALNGLTKSKLEMAKREAGVNGNRVETFLADVSDPSAAKELVEQVKQPMAASTSW